MASCTLAVGHRSFWWNGLCVPAKDWCHCCLFGPARCFYNFVKKKQTKKGLKLSSLTVFFQSNLPSLFLLMFFYVTNPCLVWKVSQWSPTQRLFWGFCLGILWGGGSFLSAAVFSYAGLQQLWVSTLQLGGVVWNRAMYLLVVDVLFLWWCKTHYSKSVFYLQSTFALVCRLDSITVLMLSTHVSFILGI